MKTSKCSTNMVNHRPRGLMLAMMMLSVGSKLQPELQPELQPLVSAFSPHQSLQRIHAISQSQPSRRRRRRRRRHRQDFFAMEQQLPPLSPAFQEHHEQYYIPSSSSSSSSNGTTTSCESSFTMPYSSSSSNGGFPISYLFDDLDEEDEEMLSYSTENAGEEGKQEGLPVLYTNDPYQLNQWLVEHVPMDPCCIGFDTESVPDVPWITNNPFKGRPITVQLATTKASIVVPLVRNDRYSKACLPLLEVVLEDANIVKCGCGLDDDVLDLRCAVPGWKDLEVRSRFDLGLLGTSNDRLGLKSLTRIVLQQDLEKPRQICLSDWSQFPLSEEQLEYAARDAWVGAAVVQELEYQDPEIFCPKSLIKLLKSQPSLKELNDNHHQRQEAKRRLKQFHVAYKEAGQMPTRVKKKIYKLKNIVRDKPVDHAMESLAFIEPGAN